MCSVTDDDETFMPRKAEIKAGNRCMKCGQDAVGVIRAGDPFCRDCLILHCTHRFRSGFGKSKLVRDKEHVLVAYSGGPSSSAMVHLIQEGLSRRAQKKLRFQPALVYIDEGEVVGQSTQEREISNSVMEERMRKTGLPYTLYSLHKVLNGDGDVCYSEGINNINLNAEESQQLLTTPAPAPHLDGVGVKHLTEMFAAAQTLTAKQALLHCLRQQLLVQVARAAGVSKVLVGESATRLAVEMLSGITQGRGSSLPLHVGFADGRHGDVTLVRPMRELTSKEIAVYNNLCGIDSFILQSLDTKMDSLSSLERLTEEFVVGLQTDHPNTVPTILRTGEKLQQVQHVTAGEAGNCCMCHCPLDTSVTSCSALAATQASHDIMQCLQSKPLDDSGETAANSTPSRVSITDQSTCSSVPMTSGCSGKDEKNKVSPFQTITCLKGHAENKTKSLCGQSSTSGNITDGAIKTDSCCGQKDGSCQSSIINRMTGNQLNPSLCYGCRRIIQDMSDISALPSYILEEAQHRHRRADMRETIAEFLLPDSEDGS